MIDPNPFSRKYLEQEIAFLALPQKEFCDEQLGVRLDSPKLRAGNLRDYMNKNFRVEDMEVPVLHLRDADKYWRLWMSLTFMEVQSMWVPIQQAEGVVACGGLGLGYYPLRVAAKENVDEVIVFERNAGVIEFFDRMFKDRPERKKIEIVPGDAREQFHGFSMDFCFMDIYETLLPWDTLSDWELFTGRNEIGTYNFWGKELVHLAAMKRGLLTSYSTKEEMDFIKTWVGTPINIDHPEQDQEPKLLQFYDEHLDDAFVEKYVELYNDLP